MEVKMIYNIGDIGIREVSDDLRAMNVRGLDINYSETRMEAKGANLPEDITPLMKKPGQLCYSPPGYSTWITPLSSGNTRVSHKIQKYSRGLIQRFVISRWFDEPCSGFRGVVHFGEESLPIPYTLLRFFESIPRLNKPNLRFWIQSEESDRSLYLVDSLSDRQDKPLLLDAIAGLDLFLADFAKHRDQIVLPSLELEGKEETEKSRRTTFRNLYDSGDFYLLNHIRDYIKDGTSAERLHHLVKRSGRIALGIGVKDLNKEDFWERLQIAIKRIEKMREKYFHIIRKQRAVLEESL